MPIILKNKKAEELFKKPATEENVIEINTHSSPVTAMKKDGTMLKKHRFTLTLNGKEILIDDKIESLINNLLEQI